MSLFENPDYEWRETYFVLFDQANLPSASEMHEVLQQLGSRIEVSNLIARDEGRFESLTLVSPGDFAAMDITSTIGDEVCEQLPELVEELRPNCETDDELRKLELISNYSARMDIYHFEQKNVAANMGGGGDEIEFLDPGGLLMVLDRIGELCRGVIVDPQASSLM